MEQEQIKPEQLPEAPKLKMDHKPITVPSSSVLVEPPTTGSEEARWERIKQHKKKLEQENKRRLKKRRLVCYSCWTKDGNCCCNLTEVDADHPVMSLGGKHHWARCSGSGKCEEIPDAIPITRDGQ